MGDQKVRHSQFFFFPNIWSIRFIPPLKNAVSQCDKDIHKLYFKLINACEIFRPTGLQVHATIVSSPKTRTVHKIQKFLLFKVKIYMIQSCFVYFVAIFTFLHCLQTNWLVGCFGFNGPLRQYFSLYRVVSQREGER